MIGDRESTLLSDWLCEALAPIASASLTRRIAQAGGTGGTAAPGIDWARLFERAHAQGIAPLLHDSLDRWGLLEALGEHTLPFARARAATLRQNVIHLSDLAGITRALEAEGVRAILLKGAAFLGEIYAHPALRPMCDIDFMVRPRDVRCTLRILKDLGYQPLRPSAEEAILRTNHEMEMTRRLPDGTRVYVEVHWRLIPAESLVAGPALEPAGLWQRARRCGDPELRASVLGAEDAIVFSAIHLQRHAYAKALWFVDLALLIREKAIRWDRVLCEARAWEADSALFVALAGTRALCGVAAPAGITAAIYPGKLKSMAFDAIIDWKHMFGPRAARGEHALPSSRRYLLKLLQARDTLVALHRIRSMIFPSKAWLQARYGLHGSALPPGLRRRHLADAGRAVLGFRPHVRSGGSLRRLADAATAD